MQKVRFRRYDSSVLLKSDFLIRSSVLLDEIEKLIVREQYWDACTRLDSEARIILPEQCGNLSFTSIAVLTGRPNLVKLALEHRGATDEQDFNTGFVALHYACQAPINTAMLVHFLMHGADFFVRDQQGKLPTDYAKEALEMDPEYAVDGDIGIVRTIIAISDLAVDNNDQKTANSVFKLDCAKSRLLTQAVTNLKDYTTFRPSKNIALLARQAQTDTRGADKLSALAHSVFTHQIDVLHYLLAIGKDPNSTKNPGQKTATHYACQAPIHSDVIVKLLHAKADFLIQDYDGLSPAQYAKIALNSESDDSVVGDRNVVVALINITQAIKNLHDDDKAHSYIKLAVQAHAEFSYTFIAQQIKSKRDIDQGKLLRYAALATTPSFNEQDYQSCYRLAKLLAYLASKMIAHTSEDKAAIAKYHYDSLVYASTAYQAIVILMMLGPTGELTTFENGSNRAMAANPKDVLLLQDQQIDCQQIITQAIFSLDKQGLQFSQISTQLGYTEQQAQYHSQLLEYLLLKAPEWDAHTVSPRENKKHAFSRATSTTNPAKLVRVFSFSSKPDAAISESSKPVNLLRTLSVASDVEQAQQKTSNYQKTDPLIRSKSLSSRAFKEAAQLSPKKNKKFERTFSFRKKPAAAYAASSQTDDSDSSELFYVGTAVSRPHSYFHSTSDKKRDSKKRWSLRKNSSASASDDEFDRPESERKKRFFHSRRKSTSSVADDVEDQAAQEKAKRRFSLRRRSSNSGE